jgi:hypothetical protein
MRAWRKAHPEYYRQYRKAHPELREKSRQYARAYRARRAGSLQGQTLAKTKSSSFMAANPL